MKDLPLGSPLYRTAVERDLGECCRCGVRCRKVRVHRVRERYDRQLKKRVDVPPSLEDLVTLCDVCTARTDREREEQRKRKGDQREAAARRAANQTTAFGTDWFRTCEPREKFAGDLTTGGTKHGKPGNH